MPGFLKSAEQKLLLNKPGVWSTRTHLVLYYGLLFIIVLTAVCFLDPSDLRTGSITPVWIGFVSVICIIALVVWLIYLLRFNLFKRYGVIDRFYTVKSFILYFISAGVIVLFTYVQPAVESVRANMAYGDEEIVNDINAINTKVCELEYNSLKVPWQYDTVSLVQTDEAPAVSPAYEDAYESVDAVPGRPAPARHHIFLDSAAFHYRAVKADSLIKLSDTSYILYDVPAYAFIEAATADKRTKNKLLSSFELYNKIFKYPQPTDKAVIRKELGMLLHKYHYQEDLSSHALEIYESDGPFDIVSKKYHLVHVGTSVSNIIEKKYRWSKENLPPFIRVFYYVTLVITLLVLIFRHTTTRTFFLSLLTGVLLTILTALILSFLHTADSDLLLALVNYTILFFAASLTAFYIGKRNVITGILINLFVALAPFFPLLIFLWYVAWKKEQVYKQQMVNVYVNYPDLEKFIPYVEAGSALLFIILLVVYINKVYRRWYSLPQE